MRFRGKTTKEIVAYFDSLSIKPYDSVFGGSGQLPSIEDILTLNKDIESFIIQASASETPFLHRSQHELLQFVHFSDVHAVLELWNRMVRYINHYSDCIAFALHTGDYCGDNQDQYRDFPESNIRLIVLDQYFDSELQKKWLRGLLADAKKKDLWVITAMHEPTAEIVDAPNVTFHTLTEFPPLRETPFESVLKDYIAECGNYICNFCGHEHHDLFG